MKIVSLKLGNIFNSLEPFERVLLKHQDNIEKQIDPICLIGVNGSGKSNLLELVSEIFYFLELNHRFEKDKKNKTRTNKDFELIYHITQTNKLVKVSSINSSLVRLFIENDIGTWKKEENRWLEVTDSEEILNLLPSKIVGYTSGMNETLSFRFNLLDEAYSADVLENARKKSKKKLADNRMIFLDYESNESIIIANYLFKKSNDLSVFRKELRIGGLVSFKIIINLRRKGKSKESLVVLSNELIENLDKLKACSTTNLVRENYGYYEFDYLVNEATIEAFKDNFNSVYDLFMVFQKFELLNPINLEGKYRKTKTGDDILDVKPILAKEDRVFRFAEINLKLSTPRIEIPYIGISDGEHQFLQIIGAFMIFEQDDVLFLLDEPETHFNPSWRTKFINIINKETKGRDQEITLTTHSPFVVSDCKDYRVFKFIRDGKLCKFEPIGIDTFGTSFDIILKKAFDIENSISDEAKENIEGLLESKDINKIQKFIDISGPSFEKLALLKHLNEITVKDKKVRTKSKK